MHISVELDEVLNVPARHGERTELPVPENLPGWHWYSHAVKLMPPRAGLVNTMPEPHVVQLVDAAAAEYVFPVQDVQDCGPTPPAKAENVPAGHARQVLTLLTESR